MFRQQTTECSGQGLGFRVQLSGATQIPNSKLEIRNLARRSGISLLEVLISIFIITIGVLGVASMLPLATHLANRGTTADRAAISGREALRQFSVREMNNPDRWLTAAGAAVSVDPANTASPLYPLGAKAYCLDPRGVAAGITGKLGGTAGMDRITLRQSGSGTSGGAAMGTAVADQVFMLQDDLSFNTDNEALPPIQNTFNSASNVPEKRLTAGDFSWLATLVREGPGDRYTLSAVIVERRQTPVAEIVIPSASVSLVGGIGGGEITITNALAANENLVPGNWVMLSSGTVHRWYRIIHTSDYDTANTRRYLSVAGRDWNAGASPQITIIPGTIAAYERTVRLETSSLWQP